MTTITSHSDFAPATTAGEPTIAWPAGTAAEVFGAEFDPAAMSPYEPMPQLLLDAVDPELFESLDERTRIGFWEAAGHRLDWARDFDTVHSWRNPDVEAERGPEIRWYEGGKLNVAVNCVDRHVVAGRGEKVALYFEGEPGDRRAVTYADLQREVSQAANALQALGIGAGDRVVVYLPVLVETVVITLACARIGAVHSLVFGGFSAEALRFRVEDTGAKLLVTSDGQFRRGTAVPVKENVDAAVAGENNIEHVLVIDRTGHRDINWVEGRDVWWDELVTAQPDTHDPEFFDAEHPLFIMYTSGTTGQPKGLVHTSAGYLAQACFSFDYLFNARAREAREQLVHWCTADLAWVTAHTYEMYGPLSNGVTQVVYEGVPNAPHPGRHFEIIQRYGVTNYYTAPTLVRSLMGWWPDGVSGYDLSSIRLLGTVGEAVNPEAWTWLREQLGRGVVPMVDTWWQSETGATILSPRPTDTEFKPGCATRALPGVATAVVYPAETVDDGVGASAGASAVPSAGALTAPDEQGVIVLTRPGPAMARTVWGDPRRYYSSYWADFAEQPWAIEDESGAPAKVRGWFLAGDGAKVDADGDTWILGRIDDVINISGHRLSTIEIESALVTHPKVLEAGVTPVPHSTTGHAAVAFVVARDGFADADELRATVAREIGPVAKPADIVFVPDVPKTRSGKIMRRLLTQLYTGETLGDTTSLQNEPAVGAIAEVLAERRTK